MEIIESDLRWIGTLGGPLIVMNGLDLNYWKGDLREVDATSSTTDYDRACEVTDWVGAIGVGPGIALVLAMPNETCQYRLDETTEILVRWVWGNNDAEVLAFLRELRVNQPWVPTDIEIIVGTHGLIMFDAVYGGDELRESVEIRIPPGIYGVSTLQYKPNENVNLFLIKLSKLNGS